MLNDYQGGVCACENGCHRVLMLVVAFVPDTREGDEPSIVVLCGVVAGVCDLYVCGDGAVKSCACVRVCGKDGADGK